MVGITKTPDILVVKSTNTASISTQTECACICLCETTVLTPVLKDLASIATSTPIMQTNIFYAIYVCNIPYMHLSPF
jgi:hypothetical protein